jgi:CRP-like cAMP-binding protein
VNTPIELLAQHPLLKDMPTHDLQLIASYGEPKIFSAGDYLAREHQNADYFYLIHSGQVAIEIFFPGRGALTLQTLRDGDIVGWSWLFPPFRWTFDIRAQTTVQTTALDGCRLRAKCAEDPRLGYELMQRFAAIVVDRLQATRLQLADLYSHQLVNAP